MVDFCHVNRATKKMEFSYTFLAMIGAVQDDRFDCTLFRY